MADDDQKAQAASDAVEEVREDAQKAADAADKAEESAEKATEAAQEVKQELDKGAKAEKKDPPAGGPKATKAVSKDLEKIIESIEKLSVLELADLVKALEDRFGVTAAPAMAAGAAPAAGGTEDGASEQTSFNVIIAESGANKISVIKVVRELVPTLGLKEAKDLVDTAPKPVLEGVNKESANEAKTKLEAAGAKVELK